jgi:hypothetical protein
MAFHSYTGSLETCLQTGGALFKGMLCVKIEVVCLRGSALRRFSGRAMLKCTENT